MTDAWEKDLSCAIGCSKCDAALTAADKRILSVYDHQTICLDCKKKEEAQPDYEEASKNMIGTCLIDTEIQYGDPNGYCFYHFYPFTCK